jgi:hypothetical protein
MRELIQAITSGEIYLLVLSDNTNNVGYRLFQHRNIQQSLTYHIFYLSVLKGFY